jgi:hypothetical protein
MKRLFAFILFFAFIGQAEAAKRISCLSESGQTCTVSMASISGTTPATVFTDQATTETALFHSMSDYYYQYGVDLDPTLEYRVVCNCSSIGSWSFAYEPFETRITSSVPANFSAMQITEGGAVTAGMVIDKTGYSLEVPPPTPSEFWSYSTRELTSSGTLTTEEHNQLMTFSFDANNNVKSSPQTVVTITPAQVSAGVIQRIYNVSSGGPIIVSSGSYVPSGSINFAFGSAYDATGKEIWFTVKESKTAATKLIDVECTVTDAANAAGTVPDLDLEALGITTGGVTYIYEFNRLNTDGTHPLPIKRGQFIVEQSVR